MIKEGSKRKQVTLDQETQERLAQVMENGPNRSFSDWVRVWVNTEYVMGNQFPMKGMKKSEG